MEQCVENWFGSGTLPYFLLFRLFDIAPALIGVLAAITAYYATIKFGRHYEGVEKIKAKYIINEAKKGFSFEYKGKTYFIEKDHFKGKQLNDGQNYTIYISR